MFAISDESQKLNKFNSVSPNPKNFLRKTQEGFGDNPNELINNPVTLNAFDCNKNITK